MAGVATFSAPASAQEDRVDVMVAVDPSDASAAVATAEVSRRLSAAVGKPVRVIMASGLKDAMRASRTSENQVLIAPAHVAASAISHGYKLAGLSSASRTFVLVSQPQIASVQALKGKRLYLPQQDSLRSYIARGMLDQARMSLKDLGKVEFQNTSGAGLIALGLKATDATVAESGEAQKWLAAKPGKGRVLLTSRETPAGLAVLSHKSVAADLQAKIARWATAPEGVLPVSAQDMAKLVAGSEKTVLVDTRSAQEFNNETIQGAISAPYGEKSLKERDYDAKLDDLTAIGKLDKSKPTVCFCNGPDCWKSYKSAEQARKMGFSKVYWLRSGMPEWRAKNLPVRKQG